MNFEIKIKLEKSIIVFKNYMKMIYKELLKYKFFKFGLKIKKKI